jgi:hypothetical protein
VFDQDTTTGGVLELDGSQGQFHYAEIHLLSGEGFEDAVYSEPVAVSWTSTQDAVYVAVQVKDQDSKEEKMVLRRYSVVETTMVNGVVQTLSEGWTEILSVENKSVEVAAVAAVGDSMVVVVGTEFNADGTEPSGFVRLVNAETGYRIRETRDLTDDIVVHLSNHIDDDFIYITGWTQTAATRQAFLRKIEVSTLRTKWTVEMEATGPTAGVACIVHDADIWWGGSVEDGKILTQSTDLDEYGGKDIFIAKIQDDGVVNFVHQFGSREDDELTAMTVDPDGNAILAGDTYGSMFRSRDSTESANSDVFVMTVSRSDGSMPSIVPQIINGGGSSSIDGDTVDSADPDDGSTSQTGQDEGGATEPPSENIDPYEEAYEEEKAKEKKMETGILVFLILFLVILFGCCSYYFILYYRRSRRLRRHGSMERALLTRNTLLVTDRSHVAPVLSQFDARDVEIKRSATGGWHGSFSNDLAQGKNNYQPPDETFETNETENSGMDFLLSDSSYNDSLFKDNEDLIFMGNDEHIEQNDPTDEGGFDAHAGLDDEYGGVNETDALYVSAIQRSSAYNGLVDSYEDRRRSARVTSDVDSLVGAYNRTWNDLMDSVTEDNQEQDRSDQEIV